MKKLIILFVLLSTLYTPTVFATPTNASICGRVIRRIAPTETRGFYRYDVLVGKQIKRWSAPVKLDIGVRICV